MAENKAPKSYADAKRAYDALAKECADAARSIPKIRVEIEKRVKAELGDAEKKLADLMAKKKAAAAEMYAAEERERPQREAEAAKAAEAKRLADQEAKAKENAQRLADQAKSDKQRVSSAVVSV